MNLRETRSLFVVACLMQPALHAEVFVVDDDGPADFPEIQAAVEAAQDGDLILVRPGSYSYVFVQNKSLSIAADPPLEAFVSNGIYLSIFSGHTVELVGLFAWGEPALSVQGTGARVRVQNCDLRSGYGEPALMVSNSQGAIFTDTVLFGGHGDGLGSGGAAARLFNSKVAFYGCTIRGGSGDFNDGIFPAGNGGSGLHVQNGSFVYLSGSTVVGGAGGSHTSPQIPGNGGNGGHGIAITGSTVRLQGQDPSGGPGGTSTNGSPGNDGLSVGGADYLQLPSTPRSMSMPGLAMSTSLEGVIFRGAPGDEVYLVRGDLPAFDYQADLEGVWTVGNPMPPGEFLGTIDASGTLTATIDLDPLAPDQTEKTLHQQSYFVPASGGALLGTPASTVLFSDCTAESYCVSTPNSAGSPADLSSSGGTSVAANNLVLELSGGVPGQFGVFFYGANQASAPFGDGFLCVAPPLFRLTPQSMDASGYASFTIDNQAAPFVAGPGSIANGSTWNFQFWYRDPAGITGFNLSNGLRLSFCP